MSNPYETPATIDEPGSESVATRLATNPVFQGILLTQFLGAFNDNYFKQMVLLKCTDLAGRDQGDMQPWAMAAFALPFVLLSGLGGYVSDRFSKRSVIVGCKVAEIFVMGAGLIVLFPGVFSATTQLYLLIAVLGLMGAQSAIFGPSKYGILPELFSGPRLLPVNGAIQMTTFLAIILGMAGAGIALDQLGNRLWMCSLIAVGVAVVGTVTSLLVRPTPVAEPELKLHAGNLFIPADIWQLFRQQPKLARAILVMMLFWFIGGVVQPAVNTLGEHVFHLSKTRYSLLAAMMGLGIAMGCVIAGFANRSGHADGARWTTRGSWMIVVSLLLIATLSSGVFGLPESRVLEDAAPGDVAAMDAKLAVSDTLAPKFGKPQEGILASLAVAGTIEWLLRLSLLGLGLSAGAFVVPVQVYIQEAPPAEQKGRLIGAMNVITWVGILISAAFIFVMNRVTAALSATGDFEYYFLVFVVLAIVMAPVARWYRLPSTGVDAGNTATP